MLSITVEGITKFALKVPSLSDQVDNLTFWLNPHLVSSLMVAYNEDASGTRSNTWFKAFWIWKSASRVESIYTKFPRSFPDLAIAPNKAASWFSENPIQKKR